MAAERDFDFGTAGASARRELERRRARREATGRRTAPQHERSWETGALGEEELAASLARRCPDALVLHDRRLPGSRANIDHLAVAPSGVYVIDAKRMKGRIEVRRPMFGKAQLVIAGRDRSKLVAGLGRQVEAVRAGLDLIEQEVPLRGCFCFVNPAGQAGGGVPVLRTLKIDGFELLHPRRLAKRLNRRGPVGGEQIEVLAEALIELFPEA